MKAAASRSDAQAKWLRISTGRHTGEGSGIGHEAHDHALSYLEVHVHTLVCPMKISIQSVPFNSSIGTLLRASHLPTADLEAGTDVLFFAAGSADKPSGIVGLQIFGPIALLRSLAVSEPERRKGLGAVLVSYAEQHALSVGVHSIYLLTTTAARFFETRGYSHAKRSEAPTAIAATSQFSGLCPASSAFMVKEFDSQ